MTLKEEYVLPADAARKIGKKVREDELYYVILPLLEDPKIQTRIFIVI